MHPFVQRISSPIHIEAISEKWNELAGDNPFLRWEWLGSWWKSFGGNHELYVLAVLDECGEIIGLAPWYLHENGSRRRSVRFLGSGGACTDHLTLLSAPKHQETVAREVAAWLHSHADTYTFQTPIDGFWTDLEFVGVDENDQGMQRLMSALQDTGLTVHTQPGEVTYAIDLPESWDEYVQMCSESSRRDQRECETRIESGEFSFQVVTQVSELSTYWPEFARLHKLRRNSKGDRSCFADERLQRFLRSAADQLAEQGSLELIFCMKNDEAISAQLTIRSSDRLYNYQSGMNPAFEQDQPAQMLGLCITKREIERGTRVYDLLRGAEPYKARWRAAEYETKEFRVVSPSQTAQVRHRAWLCARAVRGWVDSKLAKPSN